MTPQSVVLDPQLFSTDLEEIMTKLRARTVGQDHAVEAFGWIFETRSLRPATNKTLARTRGRTCSLFRSTLCFGRDMFLLSRLSAFSETDRVFTNSACFVLFNHQASQTDVAQHTQMWLDCPEGEYPSLRRKREKRSDRQGGSVLCSTRMFFSTPPPIHIGGRMQR